jgi:hypothetical protein
MRRPRSVLPEAGDRPTTCYPSNYCCMPPGRSRRPQPQAHGPIDHDADAWAELQLRVDVGQGVSLGRERRPASQSRSRRAVRCRAWTLRDPGVTVSKLKRSGASRITSGRDASMQFVPRARLPYRSKCQNALGHGLHVTALRSGHTPCHGRLSSMLRPSEAPPVPALSQCVRTAQRPSRCGGVVPRVRLPFTPSVATRAPFQASNP